jgi:hypothetical protein
MTNGIEIVDDIFSPVIPSVIVFLTKLGFKHQQNNHQIICYFLVVIFLSKFIAFSQRIWH